MATLNKLQLIGRLGADPEKRFLPDGSLVTNIRIATDESYKNDKGEKVTKTEWHRMVAFGKMAEICADNLSKGRLVFTEGKVRTRKWTDEHNIDHYTTECVAFNVQFLDNKPNMAGAPPQVDANPSEPMENIPF